MSVEFSMDNRCVLTANPIPPLEPEEDVIDLDYPVEEEEYFEEDYRND